MKGKIIAMIMVCMLLSTAGILFGSEPAKGVDTIVVENVDEVTIFEGEYLNLTWTAILPDGWTPWGWKLYNGTVEIANDTTFVSGTAEEYNVSANVTVVGDYTFTMNFTANDTTANQTEEGTIIVHVIEPAVLVANVEDVYVAPGDELNLTWTATLPEDWTAEGWKLYNNTDDEVANGTYAAGVAEEVNVTEFFGGIGLYNFTMNFTANDTAANQTGVGTITVHVTDHTAPDAPTALVAVAGDANVTVNWTAPTEDGGEAITGYVVYRGNSTENISVLKELGVVLEYRDDTAENDEEYFYAVAAVNVMGEGAKSDAASATPEAPHMTIVSVEEVYVALDEYLNLTWNATLPLDSWTEEGWKLYNDTVEIANGTYDSGVEVDVNVSANLTIEGDYTFTMNFTANDTAANVTVGTTITVHVGNFTAPDNTTALAAVAGDGNITLTWTAPAENGGAPITSYRVYRGEAEDSLTILMTVEDTELLDATAVNGVKYFYAVAAVNVIGEGEQGGVINATPATVPDAPVSLAAAAGDTNVTLTWDAPADNGGADITEYVVYRGDAADSLVALTDTVTVLEFLDTGLTNDVKYFYAVAAVNSVGEGAQCTDVNATPVSSATVPGAPLNLETFSFDAEVDLTWDVPTDNGGVDITSYVVYRGDAADNLTMLIDSLTSTLYDDTSVTNDVIYFYAVAAVNSVGEGAQCTAVSATPEEIYTGPSFEDITISASGTTKTIGVFNGVNFTKGGEDYVAMIYAVTSAKVTVIIGSNLQATTPTVQWVNVTVGSTMNVDTDGNGKSDLAITANSVDATAQTTSMTLKTLAEEEDDDGNGMLIAIILVVVIVVVLLLVVMMKKKGGAPTGSITEVVEEPVEEVVEEEVVEEEVLEEVE